MSLIKAKKIVKNYQIDLENFVAAIKGIANIDIEEGEFVSIMGPSGSGKSTLLNILTSIDFPTGGSILIDNVNARLLSEGKLSKFRYEYLGFIFQDLNILDELSVYDNIAIPLAMASVDKHEIKSRVEEVMTELGIEQLIKKQPDECSGGQLQRVAIARALITKPKLIVADEPTGNLDAKTTDDVLNLFKKFYQKGNTIVMVTHDCYVASFANRVLYLKDGLLSCEITRGNQTQKEFFDEIVKINADELGD